MQGQTVPGEKYDRDVFQDMQFDPFAVPEGRLFHDYYQKIRRNRGMWSPPVDMEDVRRQKNYDKWSDDQISELCQIVVLVVDRQSELYTENDLEWKIGSAIHSLGIDDPVVVEEALQQGAFFDQMLFSFFRMVNDLLYEQWWSTKTLFHNLNFYVRLNRVNADETTVKGVRAANSQLNELRRDILEIQATLFPGDERIAQAINDMAIAEEIGGPGESYARDFEPLLGQGSPTGQI